MIVTLAIGLCVLYIVYTWFYTKPKNFPPGPSCLPVVGSVLSMPKTHAHLHMMDWRTIYGPLVGFMFGSNPAVAVCDPKLVLEVLRREEFQLRPDTFFFRSRSFGKRLGVFFSDGTFWLEQRRFALRHLRDFGFGQTKEDAIMHDEVSYLIKKLESSKTVEVSGLFTVYIVNILWVVLTGNRIAEDDYKYHDLFNSIFDLFRAGDPSGGILNVLPYLRFFNPQFGSFKTLDDANIKLQELFKEIISEHERTLDPENPRDFMDVYIREKQLQQSKEDSTFTDESLIVLCVDLLSAGTESTANTLGFALMYLVMHPEVQRKVHEELDRVLGRDRLVTLADKTSLPYVEAVIAETMRCNTIAPLTALHRSARDTELGGYFVPKDAQLVISLWSLLHDKDHWGDPQNFRPERFIGPSGKFVKDDWLINFGTDIHLIVKKMEPGPLKCRYSDKVFTYGCNAYLHEKFGCKKHPSGKMSCCSICGKLFARGDSLKIHVKTCKAMNSSIEIQLQSSLPEGKMTSQLPAASKDLQELGQSSGSSSGLPLSVKFTEEDK